MKQTTCKDLNELPELLNPNSEDPAITKYQFLQCASSAPESQMKEVLTMEHLHAVAIDDGHNGFNSDITRGPLDLLVNADCKKSEGFGVVSDSSLEQCCPIMKDGINPQSLSSGIEMTDSDHFRSPSRNDLISPSISESPSSNGCVDAGMPNGANSIKESSLSVPASEMDENNIMRDVLSEDHPVCGLEVEEMDVVLHTDFINYCNKFYSAIVIWISANSIRMNASGVKEEPAAIRLEWDVDDIVSIESQWSSVASVAKVKLSLLSKDAVQTENAQGTSGVEVLEFLVHDPDWSQRQEQIMSLNVRYKRAWSTGLNGKIGDGGAFIGEVSGYSSDPYIPNFEVPFEEVVYPEGDVDAVTISKRDVDLLQPEIFVNDTLIDFYAKFLKNQIPPEERHRFHFFNSFFFRKLADLDKNPSSDFDSEAAFQHVRKWTRKVNIFEKDCIFIPVNYNLHWSLIVICHPGEIAKFSDEDMDESLKVPCILHMDSIRGSHVGLKNIVQSYLWEEWKERQKETSEDIHSKFTNLRFLSLELPQQENCFDCGLFLLHYVELFVEEAPANFSPFVINKYENFLKPDWFMPAEASLKRVHIQRLINDLLKSHSQASSSPSTNHESHLLALPQNCQNDNGIEIIFDEGSPGKSWKGNLSYSLSIQGMNTGLLDVSLCRTSQCISDSDVGMKELLEQCQCYDQGASIVQKEIEADDHLSRSILGQAEVQTMDGTAAGASHIGYSSRLGNSELSDQPEPPEGNSSPVLNYSSDDSKGICDVNRQGASSASDENLEQTNENLETVTESHASAFCDMMGNPAEDSRESHENCRSNNYEDPRPSTNPQDAVQLNQQELDKNDNAVGACVDDKLVEGAYPDLDEEHAAKRVRLTPLRDEEVGTVPSLHK